ncbi:TetR/AcrR family transcriptional regulator [Dysosmobacter sp.]
METGSTKQRILEEALGLFSLKGFDAVSVEQIAAAVGIKAPSLYKHYKSKQAIFDAIFVQMQHRYDAQAAAMELHLSNAGCDGEQFAGIAAADLTRRVQALVRFSLHDEFVSRFRRLMTLEQFRTPELAALYTQRYVTRILSYHEELFRGLIARGELRGADPRAMAWQYVSPVLVLLSICDRQPEWEDAAMKELEAHVRQFQAVYEGGK